jgi:type III secretory pathway component EscS
VQQLQGGVAGVLLILLYCLFICAAHWYGHSLTQHQGVQQLQGGVAGVLLILLYCLFIFTAHWYGHSLTQHQGVQRTQDEVTASSGGTAG